MKKLLVLALIMAVAPLASATFTLEKLPAGPAAYTISISSDVDIVAASSNEMYWALLVDAGALTDVGASAKKTGTGFDMQINGDISGAGLPGIGTWGTLFTTGGAITAGQLFDGFAVSGPATLVSLVQILPDFSGYGQTVATLVIPEPATIAVLGLGGLLLRRKK